MSNKSPHIIISAVLYSVAHNTQLGTELLKWAFGGHANAFLGSISNVALAVSLAFFVIEIIPRGCRAILASYAWLGGVHARICTWVQGQLVTFLSWMLARLVQDDPLPSQSESQI